MARYTLSQSTRIECAEGSLALLGNALVLIALVGERVDVARQSGQDALLSPAASDLAAVGRLIRRAQNEIKNLCEEK